MCQLYKSTAFSNYNFKLYIDMVCKPMCFFYLNEIERFKKSKNSES